MSSGKHRGYVRPSIRHKPDAQHRALEEAGAGVVYEEGRKGETWGALVKSLRRGDVVLVTSLARIASNRADLRIALADIAARGATLLEVSTGRRITAECVESAIASLEAADELAQDRRAFSSRQATKAAQKRWAKAERDRERTPKHLAIIVWRNTDEFPLESQALAHPDMTGWTSSTAHRAMRARYPKRLGGRKPKRKT